MQLLNDRWYGRFPIAFAYFLNLIFSNHVQAPRTHQQLLSATRLTTLEISSPQHLT